MSFVAGAAPTLAGDPGIRRRRSKGAADGVGVPFAGVDAPGSLERHDGPLTVIVQTPTDADGAVVLAEALTVVEVAPE